MPDGSIYRRHHTKTNRQVGLRSAGSRPSSKRMSKVTFQKSGKTFEWTGANESILELAEANGIDLDFGCRMGNCTACQQPVLSGEVDYPMGHTGVPEEGNQLLCCSVPKGDVVIDA